METTAFPTGERCALKQRQREREKQRQAISQSLIALLIFNVHALEGANMLVQMTGFVNCVKIFENAKYYNYIRQISIKK